MTNRMIELFRKIHMNSFFWVVIGIGVVTGYFREIMMIFIIVFIHELGHAVAATFFKWKIYKVELLPFGGVAEVDGEDIRPLHEELIVILAGPLQHILLFFISYFSQALPIWSESDHQIFVFHNTIILIFNLLPILPLDGGRLMKLFFTMIFPYAQAQYHALVMSMGSLIAVCFFSALYYPYHLNLWAILLFLLVANYTEWKQRYYRFIRFLLSRKTTDMYIDHSSIIQVNDVISVRDALKLCRRGYHHYFKVYRTEKKTTFVIEERHLLQLMFSGKWASVQLSSIPFSRD